MKVILDIPNYEFNNDIEDKFQDYFERVKADIANGTLCGNYELETTDMFLASFKRMQVLPYDVTNGDMIRAMFPKARKSNYIDSDNKCTLYIDDDYELEVDIDWWNAPYKVVNE